MVSIKEITSSDAYSFGTLTNHHKDQTTPRAIVAPALSVSRAASQKRIHKCVKARQSRNTPLTPNRGAGQARQFLSYVRSRIRPNQSLKVAHPPVNEVLVSSRLSPLNCPIHLRDGQLQISE
jgi:hypothetical protein